jgi:hypothetical protein
LNIIFNEEFLQGQSVEFDILKNITKENIFSTLKKNGFNPEKFLYTRKLTYKATKKFNYVLRKTGSELSIPLYEIILYLSDNATVNFLLSELDDKNKQIIRAECIHKFHINDDDCILFDVLS